MAGVDFLLGNRIKTYDKDLKNGSRLPFLFLGIFVGAIIGIAATVMISSYSTKQDSEAETLKRSIRHLNQTTFSNLSMACQNQTTGPCPLGWAYFAESNSCYYHQNFAYDDNGTLNVYLWQTAESNCQKMNGHLASVHSQNELNFIKKLITSNIKAMNPRAQPRNACYESNFYAWIGLNGRKGKGKWSDGTKGDFVRPNLNHEGHSMCNDISTPNPDFEINYSTDPRARFGRYVCKKGLTQQ